MDKERQCRDTSWNAAMVEPAYEMRELMVTLFVLASFATLLLIALTEHFTLLPSAVAAQMSAWFILRL